MGEHKRSFNPVVIMRESLGKAAYEGHRTLYDAQKHRNDPPMVSWSFLRDEVKEQWCCIGEGVARYLGVKAGDELGDLDRRVLKRGRYKGGRSRRKLTFEQAEAIRARYKNEDITQRKLAEEYGVKRDIIAQIVTGRSYLAP